MSRPLPRGIYTPLPTFFDDNEDLDIASFQAHVKYVTEAGTIPVTAGSAGEAAHLVRLERVTLIKVTRSTLDSCGLSKVPIVAGAGAPSTRESIVLAKEAAEAGADFVMVIPPGYYASTLRSNPESLKRFFVDIAEASPIPIIVYNFPGVSGGIDLDSDIIIDIVKASPNVVGAKLTCASVGKITRITAEVDDLDFQTRYPRKWSVGGDSAWSYFQVIDGYIDILMPSVASGAAGAISGLPNFAPRTCVRLWDLASSLPVPGSDDYLEARRLQNLVAQVDGVAQKIGFSGMKFILNHLFKYGKGLRRPLMPTPDDKGKVILDNEWYLKILAEEKKMSTC
ncbi:putative dihydrodipicolinate synthase [Massarina eburnea CBS 473.64]|uniref:Putative dihydrodipicolinate synthase n=1 Tax=Massarina eburnea CBS 473.64 TaxID=1395130 RepID=A0A6A6S555_9PLEO|nr:putative dihydrodipicolinate synthase [Massarina eburnea CBS 473.64]